MICERCGHELQVGDYPYCRGTADGHQVGTAVVIGDECDFMQHNGTREPIRFRSKQEYKRWLKQHDYRIYDTHVGEPGSDKSKHSRNWATYDAYTAENIRILLERAFHSPHTEPPEPVMHIRPFIEERSIG